MTRTPYVIRGRARPSLTQTVAKRESLAYLSQLASRTVGLISVGATLSVCGVQVIPNSFDGIRNGVMTSNIQLCGWDDFLTGTLCPQQIRLHKGRQGRPGQHGERSTILAEFS